MKHYRWLLGDWPVISQADCWSGALRAAPQEDKLELLEDTCMALVRCLQDLETALPAPPDPTAVQLYYHWRKHLESQGVWCDYFYVGDRATFSFGASRF